MRGIFSIDGVFYKVGGVIADIMLVSLCWIMCSLPVVTIGASTTAAYYVMTRRVSKNHGYIMRDFWSSFKREFLRSTAVFMTILSAVLLLLWGMFIVRQVESLRFIAVFQWIFLFELIIISAYAFPILSRFDMKYASLFKTAFYMANRHFLTTIVFAGVIILIYMLGTYSGFFYVLSPGIYCFLTSYFFIRIFKKYRPEIDADSVIEPLAPLNLGDEYGGEAAEAKEN